ncbi:T9SS type A sorting domain-containing protein [Flavobacterium pedocola]
MRIYVYQLVILLFSVNTFSQAPALQWQKSLGGTNGDILQSIKKTSDGGFIVSGYTTSVNGDVTTNHGDFDYWVAKVTDTGTIIWQKSFGGSGMDLAKSAIQTTDGGFIVSGNSMSNNGDATNNKGGMDYWILKLDTNGTLLWEKSLGGSFNDYAGEIQETNDGGLILTGYSSSTNGDVTGNHGDYDYWVVKLNAAGGIVWQKPLGGSLLDQAFSIKQTTDGGYIVAGAKRSSNGDATLNYGSDDCWIVKLDASGNLIWQKSFGGTGQEFAYSIIQATDGGYVFAGFSTQAGGDVTVNHGGRDCWIVKLDSSGTLVWQHSLGGSADEIATEIIPTQDGNYLVSAYSTSSNGDLSHNNGLNDFWVLKISTSGTVIWQKNLGGSGSDQAYAIEQAADGGIVVAGSSSSNNGDASGNHGSTDFWLVKLAAENLSTSEFETKQTIIYPNPASNFIKITGANMASDFTFKIVDVTGKIVQKGFSKSDNPITIENLANGTYLLQMEAENGIKTSAKFIKK